MAFTLGELAERFGCELRGDAATVVDRVDGIHTASATSITFLSNPSLKGELAASNAAAAIIRSRDLDACPMAALLTDNPYATYARVAQLLHPAPPLRPGVHDTAVVEAGARLADSAEIGPRAVISAGASIGEDCVVGAGTFVGPDCVLGAGTRLHANVTLVRAVRIGERGIVHSGAVIGADGFGNAMTDAGWVKVPQIGGVRIGDDVEIGANTTIDCGAIGDTLIGNGVRIDNQCMIAHNAEIGDHTAMAGMSAVAGSCKVGKRCMFAGQSGAIGHIDICDDVVITAKTMISKNITRPGAYSSGWPAETSKDWAKTVARVRRLDALAERVARLEKGESRD